MTPQAFSSGLTLLQDIFNRSLSDLSRGVYFDAAKDLSDDVWLAAVTRCASTCRFMPVPAELRAAAEAVVAEVRGVQTPDDAWSSVLAVASGWAEGASVRDRFDEATWDALQRIGGIRVVALAENGAGITRVEKHFRAAYAEPYRVAVQGGMRLPLPERSDIEADTVVMLAGANGASR